MARVDDVVFNYLSLPVNKAYVGTEATKKLEEAVRYGFEQGESFGKYARYVGEENEEIAREIFQETKRQKVVRTYGEFDPLELQKALEEGWTVAMVNQLSSGYGLEYILEKTENLGNSKTVKNPEE